MGSPLCGPEAYAGHASSAASVSRSAPDPTFTPHQQWLANAERTALGPLAAGLLRDFDAVLAALCFEWSNDQVEGHVHRIKLVKRTMYGRAALPLLRARVLRAA